MSPPPTVKCSVLNAPNNGTITYTSQMEDVVTATYTCEPGFGLVGNPVRTCLPANNTWTGDEPQCRRKHSLILRRSRSIHYISIGQCPKPSSPANGGVEYTGNFTGDNAMYTCDTGFELVGSEIATCEFHMNENSTSFTPPAPTCRRKSDIIVYVHFALSPVLILKSMPRPHETKKQHLMLKILPLILIHVLICLNS